MSVSSEFHAVCRAAGASAKRRPGVRSRSHHLVHPARAETRAHRIGDGCSCMIPMRGSAALMSRAAARGPPVGPPFAATMFDSRTSAGFSLSLKTPWPPDLALDGAAAGAAAAILG